MRRLALLVVALLGAAARADLFSPGELSKAHAELSGLSQCTKCHPAGGQLSQATCLACHDELQPRLGKGLGLHGRISEEKRNCEVCHHEHEGADGRLIEWGPGGEKGFEHQRAGWPLKGKHADVKCKACHEPRLIRWPKAVALLKVRPHTRLGLGTGCPDCHFDEHRGQLKQDCEYCHVEKGWTPTQGFRHDETEYPLKGKHAKVKCDACHPAEKDPEAHGFPAPRSERFTRYAPVEHRTCLDCHEDPHQNRFGQRCESCHTVNGWDQLITSNKEREFHEKTKFPLKGGHRDVECRACHGPFPGKPARFKGLPFDQCTDCHADAHLGQLAVNGKGPDCDACHAVEAFAPARYGLEAHAKSRYPLEGAHAAVPCVACHPATPALQAKIPRAVQLDLKRRRRPEVFSFTAFDVTKPLDACKSCHADPHDGQFTERTCERCHEVASFTRVAFDHQRDSRFALEGAHAEVACDQCHFAPGPKAAVRYRPLERTCAACHLDVHVGQFSKSGAKADCASCHGVQRWKDLTFRHEPPFTTFLLDGAHAKARCESCHRPVTVAPAVTAARYRGLPRTCEGCHADFHQGAFRGFEP